MRHPVGRAAALLLAGFLWSGCGGGSGSSSSPTSPAAPPTTPPSTTLPPGPPPLPLKAMPVDEAAVRFMAPYGQQTWPDGGSQLHDGIDFGTTDGGAFFAATAGTVSLVTLDTGLGFPGTNYRVLIRVTDTVTLDYHFEVGGTVSEGERRANVLVSEGQAVASGQPIANLLVRSDAGHVHFGVVEGASAGQCPLSYFTPDLAARLEALYDSGVEKRPSSRADLCQ
jgi:murein DD-endopeptidase MepM/ murein hydrolase activator NlpD